MNFLTIILLVILGVCSGGMTSLIGASAVMIVIPALSIGMNMTIQQTIGTSLMVDVIGSLAVSLSYFKHGNIDIKRGFWIALGSVAGAQAGALFASEVPEVGLGSSFGIFLAFFGLVMLIRGAKIAAKEPSPEALQKVQPKWQRILISVVIGFALGIVSGLLGAGGGINFLIVLLFVVKLPLHKAIGTSTFIMAITALSGAIGHGARGNIDLTVGLIVGVGTIIGGLAGARYANRVSEKILGRVTGVIFIGLGIAMTAIILIKR